MLHYLFAQPIATLHDIHIQHQHPEMIQLAPGVMVRADIWPDDYVPTVQDLLAVGLSIEDAEAIFNQRPSTQYVTIGCTWGEIKICFRGGCVPRCCAENCPDKNEGYLYLWRKYDRHPPVQILIPHYIPPAKPAFVGFLRGRGWPTPKDKIKFQAYRGGVDELLNPQPLKKRGENQ